MAITNTGTNTLSSNLKTILPKCDKVDALVGYFYFSGFQDLHDELKDKQIRILVGMDIDKKIIEKVSHIIVVWLFVWLFLLPVPGARALLWQMLLS